MPVHSKFYEACRDGEVEEVKRLLEEKVDPNSTGIDGTPAVWVAALYGWTTILEMLVEEPAPGVDRRDLAVDSPHPGLTGETALGAASRQGHWECVNVLLGAGADPAREDKSGKTALDEAEKQGHAEVAKLLRARLSDSAYVARRNKAFSYSVPLPRGSSSSDDTRSDATKLAALGFSRPAQGGHAGENVARRSKAFSFSVPTTGALPLGSSSSADTRSDASKAAPTEANRVPPARHGAAKAAPAEMAALTRQSSTDLARQASASERSKRLEMERYARTLEAEKARADAELQAAQAQIEGLKAQMTACGHMANHANPGESRLATQYQEGGRLQRARPDDLSQTRSTQGNARKVRATPPVERADAPQPSEPQHGTHDSNDMMSRTSTFADLEKELDEAPNVPNVNGADDAGASALHFSRTSTEPMSDNDMGRTSTVEMGRTSTVEMGRTSTLAMSSSRDTSMSEDEAFVAELRQTVSMLAASGTDTELTARAVSHLRSMVQDSQGQVVTARQNAVAEASGQILLHVLRVYTLMPLLQDVTLDTLLWLCRNNTVVCDAIAGAGGAQAALATMAAHMREAKLQHTALELLSQLAQHGGPGTHTALVDAKVVQAIVTALNTLRESAPVLYFGCITLNSLLCTPTVAHRVAAQVRDFGILKVVQAVLPLHFGNPEFGGLLRNAQQLSGLMSASTF